VAAPPPSIRALLANSARRLAETSDSPRLDAELLLRHLLRLDKTQLILQYDSPVEPDLLASFEALLQRRLRREPVAYLTGHREFMGLIFAVGPGVLVPRPETELLVERALEWLADRAETRVLDVGTGSGVIALSLAALVGRSHRLTVVATERARDALAYARRNLDALDRLHRVHLVRSDLAAPVAGTVDLVLANLPYLTPDQIAGSPTIAAEPTAALCGGADGLSQIRRLIADLPRLLRPGGAAGLEIDPGQLPAATSAASEALPGCAPEVIYDLAGHARQLWLSR
jgi:release factor glutamine methyltransferase